MRIGRWPGWTALLAPLVAVGLLLGTATPVAGDVGFVQSGHCTGFATWRMEVGKDGGHLNFGLKVNGTQARKVWRVRIWQNGLLFYSSLRSANWLGDLGVQKDRPDRLGLNTFTVRARQLSNGQLCTGTIKVPASRVYGSGIGMDSLNNTPVGGPNHDSTSYRFRATTSAMLTSVRVYIMGPDRAGYGAGTGGTWRVTVQTDDGTSSHGPSGTVLASTTFRPVSGLQVISWSTPAALVAGRLYHVAFRNIDPDPTTNYASVNGVFMYQPTSPRQAAFSNVDWGQPTRSGTGPWSDQRNTVPIMQLNYASGTTAGLGYMEVWVNSPKSISSTAKAREAFTVSGPNRVVHSFSVRLARTSGTSPLTVRLEEAGGTLVEQGVIPASRVAVGTRPTWATYTFTSPRVLVSGRSYHVVLSTANDTTYSIFVIRKGSSWGFRPTTYFADGSAQYNPGSGWVAFDPGWRGPFDEGSLQFYFR